MRTMNLIKLVTIFGLIFSGCSTVEQLQGLNPETYYRQDVCFEEGDQKFCGVGVFPFKEEYKIQITNKGRLSFFSIMSCHEESTSENPDRGWFKKKGRVEITYSPTIERGRACPLYISAYNKRVQHGFGIALFEHPKFSLPAVLYCNGEVKQMNGTSICQSRQGLIQRVEFTEPVKLVKPVAGAADRKTPCPSLGEDYKTMYEFKLPNRECWYGFIGKRTKKIHMMMTVGYEEIIVRGDNDQ